MTTARFTPRDPNYEERIRSSFSRQTFMDHIGARIVKLAPGLCIVEAPFRQELAQQHGYFHGGVVGALADNAGAYAAFTMIEAQQSMLTVEYKVNLLAPAKGQTIIARGEVLRAGRVLTVCESKVSVMQDGVETLCASGLVTMMTLTSRGDGVSTPPA